MINSQQIDSSDVAAIRAALLVAGTVTLFFPRTSRTFTFQLWEPKPDGRRRRGRAPLFVSHVQGNAKPRYLGMLSRGRTPGFRTTAKSPTDPNHPPLVAFRWLWEERVAAGKPLGPVTFAQWVEEPEPVTIEPAPGCDVNGQPLSGLDGRPVEVTDPHPTYVPDSDPDGETAIDF